MQVPTYISMLTGTALFNMLAGTNIAIIIHSDSPLLSIAVLRTFLFRTKNKLGGGGREGTILKVFSSRSLNSLPNTSISKTAVTGSNGEE